MCISPKEFETVFEAIRFDNKNQRYRNGAKFSGMHVRAWEAIYNTSGSLIVSRGTTGRKAWRIECCIAFSSSIYDPPRELISLKWGTAKRGNIANAFVVDDIKVRWGDVEQIRHDLSMVKMFAGKF